jgi:hypothetical protein
VQGEGQSSIAAYACLHNSLLVHMVFTARAITCPNRDGSVLCCYQQCNLRFANSNVDQLLLSSRCGACPADPTHCQSCTATPPQPRVCPCRNIRNNHLLSKILCLHVEICVVPSLKDERQMGSNPEGVACKYVEGTTPGARTSSTVLGPSLLLSCLVDVPELVGGATSPLGSMANMLCCLCCLCCSALLLHYLASAAMQLLPHYLTTSRRCCRQTCAPCTALLQ